MGKYDNRILEMRNQLDAQVKGEKNPMTKKLDELIGQWAAKREALLDDLADSSKWKPFSEPLQERWTLRIKQARLDLCYLFGDSAKDLMLPPALQLWWTTALSLEDEFLIAPLLGAAPRIGAELNTYQVSRANLILELLEKWSWLLTTKDSFQAPEMQTIDEIDRLIQEIINDFDTRTDKVVLKISELRKRTAALAEKVGVAVKKSKVVEVGTAVVVFAVKVVAKHLLDLPGELTDAIGPVRQVLETGHTMAEQAAARAQSQVQIYRELLSRERGTPLRMFKTNREEVERYQREHVDADIKYNDACAAINGWADSRTTDGQKKDALVFAGFIVGNLKGIWEINKETVRVFEDKFSGVFYGQLKVETLEKLAQQYLFKQKIELLKSRGGARKIMEFSRQHPTAVDAEIEKAFEPLLQFDSETPPEIRELMTLKSTEFKAHVRQHLQPSITRLLNVNSTLQEVFGESRLAADFDRQQLLDDIK